MSTLKPLKIDIVSDVVCPWCYIGKRRIENALALVPDVPVEVRWRPFFLNSWVPREGISRDEYLTAKFGSVEAYKGIAGRVVTAERDFRDARDLDLKLFGDTGRTARAGATGTVVSFVQPEQARDFARLQRAAGVEATIDSVRSGHPAVRRVAESGVPLSVAPRLPAPVRAGEPVRRKPRHGRPAAAGSRI